MGSVMDGDRDEKIAWRELAKGIALVGCFAAPSEGTVRGPFLTLCGDEGGRIVWANQPPCCCYTASTQDCPGVLHEQQCKQTLATCLSSTRQGHCPTRSLWLWLRAANGRTQLL